MVELVKDIELFIRLANLVFFIVVLFYVYITVINNIKSIKGK